MNEFTILLLCTGAIIGVVILVFAFRLMKVDKEVESKQTTSSQLSADPATPPPAPHFNPPPDPDPSFTEVATLIRAPDGMLALQANGNLYLRREDITDLKLLAALDELGHFLRKDGVLPSLAAPPGPAASPKPVEDIDGKPTVYMSAREAAQVPLTTPSLDIMKQYRYLRERDKQPQIKIKTVLEEIDELVQEKTVDAPLAKRGLKVSADAAGAALFLLDGRSYSTIDEVPDPEARALVKEAIQEWEKKK